MRISLTPMLTVRDADRAVAFYKTAFGASEVSRTITPSGQRIVEMAIEEVRFFAVDENQAAFNNSPTTLNGTTVRLSLIVDDPDDVMRRAIEAGGKEIFPMGDQPYGMRQGRIADPAGHHWLIGKYLG